MTDLFKKEPVYTPETQPINELDTNSVVEKPVPFGEYRPVVNPAFPSDTPLGGANDPLTPPSEPFHEYQPMGGPGFEVGGRDVNSADVGMTGHVIKEQDYTPEVKPVNEPMYTPENQPITEPLHTPEIEPINGLDTNSVVENPVPFGDYRPVVNPALPRETAMGGTYDPLATPTEPFKDYQPVGGPGFAVGEGNNALVEEAPLNRAMPNAAPVPFETMASKSVLAEPPLSDTTPFSTVASNIGALAALLPREDSERFRTRWNDIQGMFVDEPRSAVTQADALVSDVIGQITNMFASEHTSLESEWKKGNEVSTEDLRKALQRYRSFFNRLVV